MSTLLTKTNVLIGLGSYALIRNFVIPPKEIVLKKSDRYKILSVENYNFGFFSRSTIWIDPCGIDRHIQCHPIINNSARRIKIINENSA